MRLARAHRIYEVEAVVTKARTHTQKKKSNCPNTKYRNNIVRLVARIAWNGINTG